MATLLLQPSYTRAAQPLAQLGERFSGRRMALGDGDQATELAVFVYPWRLSWIANFANFFASKYLRSPWSPTGFSAVRSTRIGRRRDAAARRKQEDIRWRRTRCANATTAYGLHVPLIPEELAVQRVAYRVQILQVQVVNLIAASGGILVSSAEVRPGRP